MKKHTCSKTLYTKFLQVTSQRYSALSLSEVSPIGLSHDAISDWLADTKCQPKEVWNESKDFVLNTNGVIIADETVISKNRSEKIELASYLYSGNEHDIVKGIGVLNFLWSSLDSPQEVMPFDYRIYQPPEDGKTKNDHFREVLGNCEQRGVSPEVVIADSWFSSLDNLKCIRDLSWHWVMGLRKNRVVNKGEKLENLVIPDEGLKLHLRGYGWIYVFKFESKNGRVDYIGTSLENPTREEILKYVRMRWDIEIFHRELKQTCGLEECQARTSRSQRNHIGFSILCWIDLAKLRTKTHTSFYCYEWEIIKEVISKRLKAELNYS